MNKANECMLGKRRFEEGWSRELVGGEGQGGVGDRATSGKSSTDGNDWAAFSNLIFKYNPLPKSFKSPTTDPRQLYIRADGGKAKESKNEYKFCTVKKDSYVYLKTGGTKYVYCRPFHTEILGLQARNFSVGYYFSDKSLGKKPLVILFHDEVLTSEGCDWIQSGVTQIWIGTSFSCRTKEDFIEGHMNHIKEQYSTGDVSSSAKQISDGYVNAQY